jgi:hypothetical protein
MAKKESLSNDELKEIILEHLEDMGIAPGHVQVRVLKGPKVILRGEVPSESEREDLKNFIVDITGIGNILDGLKVSRDEYSGTEEEGPSEEHELYDEDREYVGTDDVFRSVEDGVPYIPPTGPPPEEEEEETEEEEEEEAKKRGKKKKGR